MSPDQRSVQRVVAALEAVGLEAILVGVGGAQLHHAPLYTVDLDFLVRDTPLNRRKIRAAAAKLGPAVSVRPISELTDAVRLEGTEPPVDFLFGLSGGLSFESVRSRALRLSSSTGRIWLASLADIIKAKEAANRPKDLGSLVQLRETLAATTALWGELKKDEPPKAGEREARYRTRKPRPARRGRSKRGRK